MSLPYLDDAGALLPVRIELSESSGPVSPRYQYQIHVVLSANPDAIALVHEERKAEHRGALPRAAYDKLWADLLAADVLAQGGDLIGAERRARDGISFNFFALHIDGATKVELRCDYLLSQMEEAQNAARAAVVQRLKALWQELPAG